MKLYLPEILARILANREHTLGNPDAESRFQQYTVISSAGLLAMICFGFYHFLLAHYALCLLIFITAAGLFWGWTLLFRGRAEGLVYRGNCALYCVLTFYMMFLGGEDHSMILWMNILPLIIFFLLGRKEGLVWICCIVIMITIYFFLPFEWDGAHAYSPSFSVRFLVTFAIISIITYFYENFRFIYRAELEDKNSMLLAEIGERQRIETSLRESEERYRTIYLHAAEGILLINFDGDIVECNPQLIEMLGYHEQDLIGLNIFSIIHPDDLEKLPPQIDKLRAGEVIFVERRLKTSSGVYLLCEQSGKKISDDLIILLYRDITERKLAEIALEKANVTLDRLAYFDGLTHIANRRKFDQVLEKEWLRMKRGEKQLGLIIADVDYFKQFNDMYGHPAGDDCLQKVASEISSIIQRPADLIARYGGEEFVVLLPDTDYKGCREIAEKMRKKVESLRILHQASPVHPLVTMSFGVAVSSPEDLLTSTEFMAVADQALYRAKEEGRNRVC